MPTEEEETKWLRRLPKAELHLHLEGTVTPETLVALSQRHDAEPLTLDAARALYAYTDFLHFLSTFKLVCDRMLTPADYEFVAYEMARALAEQGVVHAEVYIAWGNIFRWKSELAITDVMDAVERARVRAEQELSVTILWIIDAVRQWGADEAAVVFRAAAQLRRRYPSIIGIGIGGNEALGPTAIFKEIYAEAQASGLRLTAHAGESTGPVDGPAEIRAALDIGAERIGHALEAQHDPELVQILTELQVPLELNVTSNLCTGCCPSVHEHPLPKYFEAGLLITINSDDPPMFGSNLLQEYVVVKDAFGLTLEQMRHLAANAFKASFLPEARKLELLESLDRYR